MSEQEWIDARDPQPMLKALEEQIAPRTKWLFAIALHRLLLNQYTEPIVRQALDLAEAMADGATPDANADDVWNHVDGQTESVSRPPDRDTGWDCKDIAKHVAESAVGLAVGQLETTIEWAFEQAQQGAWKAWTAAHSDDPRWQDTFKFEVDLIQSPTWLYDRRWWEREVGGAWRHLRTTDWSPPRDEWQTAWDHEWNNAFSGCVTKEQSFGRVRFVELLLDLEPEWSKLKAFLCDAGWENAEHWSGAFYLLIPVWEAFEKTLSERARMAEVAYQADVLRDLVGPTLFREIKIDPAWIEWRDGVIPRLAQEIYALRHFDQDMPRIADELEKAGCANADILDHCRAATSHFRGCWVIDRLRQS